MSNYFRCSSTGRTLRNTVLSETKVHKVNVSECVLPSTKSCRTESRDRPVHSPASSRVIRNTRARSPARLHNPPQRRTEQLG